MGILRRIKSEKSDECSKAGTSVCDQILQNRAKIKVDGQDCLPGDEITAKKCEITYRAEILGLTEEPEAFLVMNGNYVELPVSSSENGKYHVETHLILENTSWQWIRLEVRTKKKEFLGYVNPVFRGKKEPERTTFGEIKGETEGLTDD